MGDTFGPVMMPGPGCSSHACLFALPLKGQMGTNSGKCYCSDSRKAAEIRRLRMHIRELDPYGRGVVKSTEDF